MIRECRINCTLAPPFCAQTVVWPVWSASSPMLEFESLGFGFGLTAISYTEPARWTACLSFGTGRHNPVNRPFSTASRHESCVSTCLMSTHHQFQGKRMLQIHIAFH